MQFLCANIPRPYLYSPHHGMYVAAYTGYLCLNEYFLAFHTSMNRILNSQNWQSAQVLNAVLFAWTNCSTLTKGVLTFSPKGQGIKILWRATTNVHPPLLEARLKYIHQPRASHIFYIPTVCFCHMDLPHVRNRKYVCVRVSYVDNSHHVNKLNTWICSCWNVKYVASNGSEYI